MNTIHPTAIVDPKCELGKNIAIGPYAVIGPNVVIGDDSQIHSGAVITGPSELGKNSSVYSFASVGGDSQDKKFDRSKREGSLVVGDDCVIREYCSLNRGSTEGEAVTRVGNGCHFLAYSHIGHDCQVGDFAIFSNNTILAGHVRIGNHVTTGGYAGFHQFVEVGDHCMVSSRATVKDHIPPYLLINGVDRARAFTINKIGLQRRGMGAEEIALVEKAFKLYYRSETKLKGDALKQLKEQMETEPLIRPFIEFIETHSPICV